MPRTERLHPPFAEFFCPLRAIEQPMGITIAMRESIIAAGGLERMCGLLKPLKVDDQFAVATRYYVDAIEQQALSCEIATRPAGGSLHQALGDMCTRSAVSYQDLLEITHSGRAFVAPIVFWSGCMGRNMASNDLTVYCS